MAEIVLGMATSHSPMLSTPHEAFAGHAQRDRANPHVPDFDGLVREKAAWIGRELHPDVTRARHEATQAALARLRAVLAEVAPDVVIVIGDDQNEWFSAVSACRSWTMCRPTAPLPEPVSAWASLCGNKGKGQRAKRMLSKEDNELLCRVGRVR